VHPKLRLAIDAVEPIRGQIAVHLAKADLGRRARVAADFACHQAARGWPHLAAFAGMLASRAKARLHGFGAVADPMLRMFAGEVHASLVRVFAYGCALGAMALMVSEFITLPRGVVVAEAHPDSEWIEVQRPFPAFALTMPEFEHTSRYAIWRHASGGGRKDIFTFGDLGSVGATAVVELYRPGAEPGHEPEETTASIPELRLSGRPMMPRTIDTKFGTLTIEQFADHGPRGERGCLRFTRSFDDPRLEISGWYCNAGQDMVDHGMIACTLDRLTLVAAGGDHRLSALFAQAELKRTFCGANNVFLAATRKRTDWIEAPRDPRLRGRQ
jgi:hypothetical protein